MRFFRFTLLCATLAPTVAAAQQDTTMVDASIGSGNWRPFVVTPAIGIQAYDSRSAFKRAAGAAAMDFTYRFTPRIGVGVSLGVAIPETDGEYFPLVRQQAGDTSLYYRVSQRVTEYTYGVHASGMLPMGRFTPFALAGLGRYTFTMDPQATGGTRRYSGPLYLLGGGINVPLGDVAGFTIDVRDLILASFERERLDATDPLFRDDRFDAIPAGKPGPRSTVHNIRVSLGVSFVPRSKEVGAP